MFCDDKKQINDTRDTVGLTYVSAVLGILFDVNSDLGNEIAVVTSSLIRGNINIVTISTTYNTKR